MSRLEAHEPPAVSGNHGKFSPSAVKRGRGRPRVFTDYGGLDRDEFYRRRYRQKKAKEKTATKTVKPKKLVNSSDTPFVIESAPEGKRTITTGFGGHPASDAFDRVGGWSQVNGLLPINDNQMSHGSTVSIFNAAEIDDESPWNNLEVLRARIAELRISYQDHPEILKLLDQPLEQIRQTLTVTNYKFLNVGGGSGRKVRGVGAGPDSDGNSNDEPDDSGAPVHASEEEDSRQTLADKFFGVEEFFKENTSIEDAKYRCLICPTLKGGRKCETVSANREEAFEHLSKHKVRIRKALRKKPKAWMEADTRFMNLSDWKLYNSFEQLDPRSPAENAKGWLESRGIAVTDEELIETPQSKSTREIARIQVPASPLLDHLRFRRDVAEVFVGAQHQVHDLQFVS